MTISTTYKQETPRRAAMRGWIRWPAAAIGGLAVWTALSVTAALLDPELIFGTFHGLASWSATGGCLTAAAMAVYAVYYNGFGRRAVIVSAVVLAAAMVCLVIVYWQAIVGSVLSVATLMGAVWCLGHGADYDESTESFSTTTHGDSVDDEYGYRDGWDGWGWYWNGWKVD